MSQEVDNYLAHHGLAVDDEIKHYGKKGMKWGVRKDDDASSSGSGGSAGPTRKEKRAAANKEIMDARTRQAERAQDLERQAFKTYVANGEKAVNAAIKKYEKMEVDLLTNPDAETARKMTTGEKWVAGIEWGVAGVALAGYTAVKVNQMRR